MVFSLRVAMTQFKDCRTAQFDLAAIDAGTLHPILFERIAHPHGELPVGVAV
jgi:hypothetical protein